MLQLRTHATGVRLLVSPLLEARGVAHAFSTRIGGVSGGALAWLNLGNAFPAPSPGPTQDTQANLAENYRRFLMAANLIGRKLCHIHQIHSASVVLVRAAQPPDLAAEGDALLSGDAAVAVCIRTADCVPVLVSSQDGRWVAAVHAGWRGVVGGVLPATLARLARESGRPAADWVLAIGPCISPQHFEVGAEVVAQFEQAFGGKAPILRRTGAKAMIDLAEGLRLQAIQAGVPSAQIDTTDLCTYRDSDLLFSHRRDSGVTGRMAAAIAPRRASA
jgi:YfiH family protein